MTIEWLELPGEPIIVITVYPPLKVTDDAVGSFQHVVEFKRKTGGHVWRIIDFSRINMTFSEAVIGMASERDIEGGINDPDVSTIYVSSANIVKMGVKAFQEQAQYGKTNLIGLFGSLDEALNHLRANSKQ